MKQFILLLFIFMILNGCDKQEVVIQNENNISILSYDAEISETLTLDNKNIRIDPPREINYWFQHFHNPGNNLNNIYTSSNIRDKSKIISGKRGATNIIQPLFFDNNLYYLSSDGYLISINISSKEIIFKIDIKTEGTEKYEVVRGGLAYFDSKIVLVDAYGQVTLVNSIDGSIIWSKNIEIPILSPPLIYRNFIYFISSDNKIYAFSIETGEVIWSFQTIAESNKNLFTASPIAYENTIIAPFSNGELVAFDYKEGRPLWSENVSKVSLISNFDIKDIAASPVLHGGSIYSLSTNGKIVSINPINGERNWAIDLSGYRTPILSGGQVYVIDEDGKLICLDKDSGDVYWITDLKKHRRGQSIENLNLWLGPYLINSLLYNISYFGELKVISPLSGEILTTEKLGIKGIMTPPLILSNSIFVVDEESNVFELK